ncbi:peptidoglycan DD-metalloendopeptidase family protein [Brumimicrobium aurantiacum]|uniref:M23 family peptidase n=1 Tax=Brumimicrobium aurantiacum TaxID=1737063 RepID=A0A3E1F1B4_9FLAO|nr:peptidoglycan DD-metalloendopeptidase family protein [Brumimicrobium aurantiacum]RFC55595.1 M23 family peptidase [Brumimicrobium aurantiacum]
MKSFHFAFLFFTLLFFTNSCSQSKKVEVEDITLEDTVFVEEDLTFGFDLDEYIVKYDTVEQGWTWNNLFEDFDINQYTINTTAERLKDSLIDMKYILAGKPFMTLKSKKDTSNAPKYLVYEPDVFSYVTFDFNSDSVGIRKEERPIEIQEKMVSGRIEKNSNLSVELGKNFDNYMMTAAISDAIEGVYAWSVDFFKLQAGDKFVVYYDEKSVDGVPYSVDKIKYVWFEHANEGLYAFNFTDSTGEVSGYYDDKANEMKRPFLMSPVKFSRISSSFNMNRLHPIYKTRRPHLGTDYAAPTGTPILATADGTISKASRSRGNGIYVKIRHNKTYDTQYLHMSKIANGIRPGVRVKQGDVIGYVGSTGAATGPHVCYRFWKNGRQINHRSEKFPKSEPMKEEVKPEFFEYIKPLKEKLDLERLKLTVTPALEPEV